MRIVLAVLFSLMAGSAFNAAKADPYKWCANYGGGRDGGSTNCYFVTIEQCRAAVSGVGGFCAPNLMYDGRPVETPGAVQQNKKKPQ